MFDNDFVDVIDVVLPISDVKKLLVKNLIGGCFLCLIYGHPFLFMMRGEDCVRVRLDFSFYKAAYCAEIDVLPAFLTLLSGYICLLKSFLASLFHAFPDIIKISSVRIVLELVTHYIDLQFLVYDFTEFI